jgi:hypothetical protein
MQINNFICKNRHPIPPAKKLFAAYKITIETALHPRQDLQASIQDDFKLRYTHSYKSYLLMVSVLFLNEEGERHASLYQAYFYNFFVDLDSAI